MKNIIMFTTETWPHCDTAKRYLREKGYLFEEKDINKDISARNQLIKRGIRGVPTFLIGDDVVEGLDTKKIESLIDYNIINCTSCNTRLRVPKNKGKISATCPKCNATFYTHTGDRR